MVSLDGVLIFLAAAVLGWVLRPIVGHEVGRLWQRLRPTLGTWLGNRRASRYTERIAGNELEPRARVIVDFFATGGNLSALYETRSPARRPLPALWDASSRFVGRLSLSDDKPFRLQHLQVEHHAYDPKLVGRLRAQGRRLTDDPAVYVVRQDSNAAVLDVGVTNYLGSLALSTALSAQTETLTATGTLFEAAFSSFGRAISEPIPGPMLLGLDVATVFRDDQGRRLVPLHQRSSETVNAHGRWAVVPACTVVPHRIGPLKSRFGLVPYNLFKEFLEEFFGLDNLGTAESLPLGAHPDWVFDNAEGERLLKEVDAERVALTMSGAIIDLTHGSMVLCVTAEFASPEFAMWTMTRAKGSWEARHTSAHNLRIVPKLLEDPLLVRRSPRDFKLSSIVALDGMFEVLQ